MYLVTSVLHIKTPSAELSSSPLDTLSLKIWVRDWHVDRREGNRVWEKLQYESALYQMVRYSESILFISPAAGKIFKSDFTLCLTWKATMTQVYGKPSFISSRAQYFLKGSTTRKWAEYTLALLWQNSCTDTFLFCVHLLPPVMSKNVQNV